MHKSILFWTTRLLVFLVVCAIFSQSGCKRRDDAKPETDADNVGAKTGLPNRASRPESDADDVAAANVTPSVGSASAGQQNPANRAATRPTTQPVGEIGSLLQRADALLVLAEKEDDATHEFQTGIHERRLLIKALLRARDGKLVAAFNLPAHPVTDARLRFDSGPFDGQANLSWDISTPFLRLAVDNGVGDAAAQSILRLPSDRPKAMVLAELASMQFGAADNAGALKSAHLASTELLAHPASVQGWVVAASIADTLEDLGDATSAANLLGRYPHVSDPGNLRFSPQWMVALAAQGDRQGAIAIFRGNLTGYEVNAQSPNDIQAVAQLARRTGTAEVLAGVKSLHSTCFQKLDLLLAIATMQRRSHAPESATTFSLAEEMAGQKIGYMMMVERAYRGIGDLNSASRVRLDTKKMIVTHDQPSDIVTQFIDVAIEAADPDTAREALAAQTKGDPWLKAQAMLKIADSYLANHSRDKAISMLKAIHKHLVKLDSPPLRLETARLWYRLATAFRAAGDNENAVDALKEARAAASPASGSALLMEQLAAGDAEGARLATTALHDAIAKAASASDAFTRDMLPSRLRVGEADLHWLAGDEQGAVVIVQTFPTPLERMKGYHRLADRFIDRAIPGIVGRLPYSRRLLE